MSWARVGESISAGRRAVIPAKMPRDVRTGRPIVETDDMTEFSTQRKWRAVLGVPAVLLVGTIAAACGSSTSTSTNTTGGGGAASVETKTIAQLGTILVDSKGFTLYRLSTDSANHSVCTGACAQTWPPLLVTGGGSPMAGSGVSGLGEIQSSGGEQVTYHGMPLYTFSGDSGPGQANGQDVKDTWGTWFVVTTSAPAGGGATTTTSPSGGGPAF